MTEDKSAEPGIGDGIVRSLLDTVRSWIAVIGGLFGGTGGGLLIWQGAVGSVPGVICLFLAVCTLVAAFFGLWDRDAGGWAAAFIAVVLGLAAFIVFLAALGG